MAAERVEAMIEAVVEDMRRLGYLDDARYAAMKASSLARKGRSQTAIRATLARQGVARERAEAALTTLRDEHPDPDLTAARNLARRRRLGPWRPEPDRAAMRLRDLASLVRAGFPYGIARDVIEAPSSDEPEP